MKTNKTIDTVLFDVGNVIASDYWEALWLTPMLGLADRLSISTIEAARVCKSAWKEFSVRMSDEEEYWRFCSDGLNCNIPPELIEEVERLTIKTNSYAPEAMLEISKYDIRIGIISNNTSFWYPKQMMLAGVLDFVDNDLVYLSCDKFVTKDHGELFRYALKDVEAKRTLIIDDRDANIRFARELGFSTMTYDRGIQDTLDELGYFVAPPFQKFNIGGFIHDR